MNCEYDDDGWMTIIPGLMVKEPPEPKPEIPPECWNSEKPDPEKCIRAVRAMCG